MIFLKALVLTIGTSVGLTLLILIGYLIARDLGDYANNYVVAISLLFIVIYGMIFYALYLGAD